MHTSDSASAIEARLSRVSRVFAEYVENVAKVEAYRSNAKLSLPCKHLSVHVLHL